MKGPRDWGNLDHYRDNDLYLDTEHNNTTKDYLNYQRRRHSKRRRQKYHQRAGRPEDQGYLRKNYNLGNLDQGYQ